jgi:hypothetical protein
MESLLRTQSTGLVGVRGTMCAVRAYGPYAGARECYMMRRHTHVQ